MRDLDPMIMGLADRNWDLSKRRQLTPLPYSSYKQITLQALYSSAQLNLQTHTATLEEVVLFHFFYGMLAVL